MKGCLALMFTLLFPSVGVAQGTPTSVFHDDLLEHLVGKWDIKGIVHGRPTTQTLNAGRLGGRRLGSAQRQRDQGRLQSRDVSIASRFIWEPESSMWRIVSNVQGESKPIVDLQATKAK